VLTWFLHHADEPALPSPVSKLGQLNDGGTEEFASVWLKWEVKPGGRRRRGSVADFPSCIRELSRRWGVCFLPRLAWWRSTCNTSQRPWLPQLSRQMKSTFREGEVKEEAVDGRGGAHHRGKRDLSPASRGEVWDFVGDESQAMRPRIAVHCYCVRHRQEGLSFFRSVWKRGWYWIAEQEAGWVPSRFKQPWCP